MLCLVLSFLYFSLAQVDIVDMPAYPSSSVVHATAHLEQWNFFRFTVPREIGFILHVTHSTKHDLDVYVTNHPTQLPSPRNWVYKDTNFSPNITIEGGSEPVETTYIAGIYAFKGGNVPFILYLTYNNGCPANCSGRGSCVEGACRCNIPYAGGKCEYNVVSLKTGQHMGPYTLNEGDWQYFSLPLYTQQSLQIITTLTVGAMDIYARPKLLPTSSAYYLVQPLTTPVNDNAMYISDPELGTWYFGFYTDTRAVFSFVLEEYKLCPNDCSGSEHGKCVGLYCRCNSGYFTTDCGAYRPVIMLDTPYVGYINANTWNYYTIVASSANAISVLVDPHQNTPSCYVYIREGVNPTLTEFDVHETQPNMVPPGSYTTIIGNPGLSEWKIGIYTATKCNYTITATSITDCKCVHGHCSMGVCICDPGYAGETCQYSTGILYNGVTTFGSTKKEDWSYYRFNTRNSTQVVFVLKETEGTQGYLWLYLRAGLQPTLDNYLVADKNPNSDYHRISVIFAVTPQTFDIEIGIYGSPTIPVGSSPFSLVAFEVPF